MGGGWWVEWQRRWTTDKKKKKWSVTGDLEPRFFKVSTSQFDYLNTFECIDPMCVMSILVMRLRQIDSKERLKESVQPTLGQSVRVVSGQP